MDQEHPQAVVGAFIRNQKNEVLLVKSPKWPGHWVVMGGHIDYGESFADTVVREVKEEVGLGVLFDRVIEIASFIESPHFYKPAHMIALQCECHLTNEDQTPTLDNRELQESRWFSIEDALKLDNLLPETRHTLQLLK